MSQPRFKCLLADPPWEYDDRGKKKRGSTGGQYDDTLPTDEICRMGAWVQSLLETDSYLFLWVTNAFVADGVRVAKAWGFDQKSMVTWVKVSLGWTHPVGGYPTIKPHLGVGHHVRNASEHFLVCTRGKPARTAKNVPSWFTARRPKKHSSKPEASYHLIERLCPGPRGELFARKKRKDWLGWGADYPEGESSFECPTGRVWTPNSERDIL